MENPNKFIRLITIFLILALLAACVTNGQPPQVKVDVQPSTLISAGKTASLTADVSSGSSQLKFKWSVSRGTLSATDTPAVIYTAPLSQGPDTVTIEVSNANGTTTKNVTFDVVEPTPSPTDAPPLPTDTPEPSKIPLATATDLPTSTPLPPPLIETFPQATDGEEFVFSDLGGSITNQFVTTQNCVHSGASGLRLNYDMKGSGFGGWGVNWINASAGHFNAADFANLSFWVRGMEGGETFQIGLKDTNEKEVKIESKTYVVVTTGWSQVTVPLSKFKGVNTAAVRNVNFGFNKNHGSGSICIDDIAFTP
jgi:hypothetical protein